MHKTKSKGDVGVTKVVADLTEKGCDVLLPIAEHLPFDLVVMLEDGTFRKVQVKYRTLAKNGAISLGLYNVRYDSTKNGTPIVEGKKVDLDSFDWYAIYCPETDKCYYVSIKELKTFELDRMFSLRVVGTKNGQIKGVREADKYLILPV